MYLSRAQEYSVMDKRFGRTTLMLWLLAAGPVSVAGAVNIELEYE